MLPCLDEHVSGCNETNTWNSHCSRTDLPGHIMMERKKGVNGCMVTLCWHRNTRCDRNHLVSELWCHLLYTKQNKWKTLQLQILNRVFIAFFLLVFAWYIVFISCYVNLFYMPRFRCDYCKQHKGRTQILQVQFQSTGIKQRLQWTEWHESSSFPECMCYVYTIV